MALRQLVSYITIINIFNFVDIRGFHVAVSHTNDVHAHFEEMGKYTGPCKDKDIAKGNCFGGVARRMTKIKEIRNSYPNNLLLDAGDQYQGSLWFLTFKGFAASYFMNRLGYDAMTLGNHEFDKGVDALVPFLDNISFPVVTSNLDVTNEPRLQGRFNKSLVLEVGRERIGIVGYTTRETISISSPGRTVIFQDEIQSVRTEVQRLKANGIRIIFVLGHGGYKLDKKMAREVEDIDVIIGGHTHTFLYTGDQPSVEEPQGDYPTIIEQASGRTVLVVQAFAFAKYLGFLNLTFDEQGEITSHLGSVPILLDNSTAQDSDILRDVDEWKKPLEIQKQMVKGHSSVHLEGSNKMCRLHECNLGNVVADSIVTFFADKNKAAEVWTGAAIALVNSGGVRTTIEAGNITMEDVLTVMPFGNYIDTIDIRGEILMQALEHSVDAWDTEKLSGAFLQYSGIRVTYDLCKPIGKRVVDADIKCRRCSVPKYEKLNRTTLYTVAVSNFLISGGDSYTMLENNEGHNPYNFLDSAVFSEYLMKHKPLIAGLEDRIQFIATDTADECIRINGVDTQTHSNTYKLILIFHVILISVSK